MNKGENTSKYDDNFIRMLYCAFICLMLMFHLNIFIQTVPDLQWFKIFLLYMFETQDSLSRNHTSNFEFSSFPGLAIHTLILSLDAGRQERAIAAS